MEIYVIRHTSVAVGKDTCYGQTNVPLADSFKKEAAQYATELPKDFDAIYCSPLNRCKDLSQELGFKEVVFDQRLMELNFGDWENRKWNDIDPTELNTWMEDFVNKNSPNGESLLTLFKRTTNFLDQLRKEEHEKVLLITHSGVIRCFWAYLLEIPLKNIFKLPVNFNETFVFKLTSENKTDSIKRIK